MQGGEDAMTDRSGDSGRERVTVKPPRDIPTSADRKHRFEASQVKRRQQKTWKKKATTNELMYKCFNILDNPGYRSEILSVLQI